MDLQSALERLEAARLNSADLEDPEFAEAWEVANASEAGRAILQARQVVDAEIAHQMQSVEVPDGLDQRILQSLPVGMPAETPLATPAAEPPRQSVNRSRRRWLSYSLTAAGVAALAIVVAFWPFAETSNRMTMQQLRELPLPANANELVEFQGSFVAELPRSGWRQSRQLQTVGPLGGLVKRTGPHQVAVFFFELPRNRRKPIAGVLIQVPVQGVANPPAESLFDVERVVYVTKPQGVYSTVAWREDESVFVCFVPGGSDQLDVLKRVVTLTPV